MRGYVLSSAACGVSHIFPACGAPKFGVDPTPNLGRLYPCGSQNWDGRKKGACRHNWKILLVWWIVLACAMGLSADSKAHEELIGIPGKQVSNNPSLYSDLRRVVLNPATCWYDTTG